MEKVNKSRLGIIYGLVLSLVLSTSAAAIPVQAVAAAKASASKSSAEVWPSEDVLLSEEDSAALTAKLPKAVQELLVDEIDRNDFFRDESNLAEYIRLEDFSPLSKRWFYLPHLEIPLSDVESLNISYDINPDLRRLFIHESGGKKYLRYFLHPFRELKNYEEVLKQYPLKYQYVARPTSSPRSLVVIDPDKPKQTEWVKVSLHVKVTDLQRRQKPEKLARALAVNEALNAIPESTRKKLQFGWLPEPIAVQLPGKEEVIIGRDIRPYLKSGKHLRSTFSLFSSGDEEEPEIRDLIKRSGLDEIEFFKRYLISPTVNVFAYLGFVEGIQWGMHTANYMIELDSKGLPTGKIVLKDFDGAWFDAEIRALQGRSFENIHRMMHEPFAEFLFPSATGRNSGERQHFGEIYNRYVRNAQGFSSLGSLIFGYLSEYCLKAVCKNTEKLKEFVQETIDSMMIEQVEKYTGLKFTLADMKGGHLKTNGLNRALNALRTKMLDGLKREDADPGVQELLKKEFVRLSGIKRTWTSFGKDQLASRMKNPNTVFFYDQNSGMIQVRSYKGKDSDVYSIAGYALIEDPDSFSTKSFLRNFQKQSGKTAAPAKSGKTCKEMLTGSKSA